MQLARFTLLATVLAGLGGSAEGQKLVANYDEGKVPGFKLPDPLALPGGGRISSAGEWEEKGRPATLKLIEEHR